jgi:RNA polymerase sigma-70 factor (ECF subfamily)
MPELPDAVLTRGAYAGEQQAFEMLVRRYQTALLDFSYRFLGDYDQACDVCQEVFLRLYLSLSRLDLDRPLKSWLFQVAHNCCIDELRRRHRHALPFSSLVQGDHPSHLSVDSQLDQFLDPDPLPEEALEHQELQGLLQQAIASLPPKFRAIVLLRYKAQLPLSQIAYLLHIPEATAKTYYARAKLRLRRALKEDKP